MGLDFRKNTSVNTGGIRLGTKVEDDRKRMEQQRQSVVFNNSPINRAKTEYNKITDKIKTNLIQTANQENYDLYTKGKLQRAKIQPATYTDTGKKYGDYYYENYDKYKDVPIYERDDGTYYLKTKDGYQRIGKLNTEGKVDSTKPELDKNNLLGNFDKYKKEENEKIKVAKQLGYTGTSKQKMSGKELDEYWDTLYALQDKYKLTDKEVEDYWKRGKISNKINTDDSNFKKVSELNKKLKSQVNDDYANLDIEDRIFLDTFKGTEEQRRSYIDFLANTNHTKPLYEEDSNWFKSGKGNLLEKIGGTALNIGQKIGEGIGNFTERYGDLLTMPLTWLEEVGGDKKQITTTRLGNKQFDHDLLAYDYRGQTYWYDPETKKLYDASTNKEIPRFNLDVMTPSMEYEKAIGRLGTAAKDVIAQNEVDRLFEDNAIDKWIQERTVFGNVVQSGIESAAEMIPMIGVGYATQDVDSNGIMSEGTKARVAVNLNVFATSYSAAKEQAFRQGLSNKDATVSAFIQATAETISENFFDALPGFGTEGWGEKLIGKISNTVEKWTKSTVAGEMLYNTLLFSGEGFEEIISNVLTAVGNDLVGYIDENYLDRIGSDLSGDMFKDIMTEVTSSESWEAFLIAALTSSFMGGAKKIINTKEQNKIINSFAAENGLTKKEAKNVLKIDVNEQMKNFVGMDFNERMETKQNIKQQILNKMTMNNIQSNIQVSEDGQSVTFYRQNFTLDEIDNRINEIMKTIETIDFDDLKVELVNAAAKLEIAKEMMLQQQEKIKPQEIEQEEEVEEQKPSEIKSEQSENETQVKKLEKQEVKESAYDAIDEDGNINPDEILKKEASKYKNKQEFINKYKITKTYSLTPGKTTIIENPNRTGLYHGADITELVKILDDGYLKPNISNLDNLGENVVSLTNIKDVADSYGIVFEFKDNNNIKDLRDVSDYYKSPVMSNTGEQIKGFELRTSHPISLSDVKSITLTLNKGQKLNDKYLSDKNETVKDMIDKIEEKGIKVYFDNGSTFNEDNLSKIWDSSKDNITHKTTGTKVINKQESEVKLEEIKTNAQENETKIKDLEQELETLRSEKIQEVDRQKLDRQISKQRRAIEQLEERIRSEKSNFGVGADTLRLDIELVNAKNRLESLLEQKKQAKQTSYNEKTNERISEIKKEIEQLKAKDKTEEIKQVEEDVKNSKEKNTMEEKIQKDENVIEVKPTKENIHSWAHTATKGDYEGVDVVQNVVEEMDNTYKTLKNKKVVDKVESHYADVGYDQLLKEFKGKMDSNERLTAYDAVTSIKLLLEASKMKKYDDVRYLMQSIEDISTETGQFIQAYSLLNKTPQGQLKKLTREVERLKKTDPKHYGDMEITNEMIDKIYESTEEDLDKNVSEVKDLLAKQAKGSIWDKLRALRFFSMLARPRTHVRNIETNVSMLGTRSVKKIVQKTIEGAVSKVAPNALDHRTISWNNTTDEVKQCIKDYMKNNPDKISKEGKYEVKSSIASRKKAFGEGKSKWSKTVGKKIQQAIDFNYQMLGNEDLLFKQPAFEMAMREYLTANGIKTKEDFDSNPKLVNEAVKHATKESLEATFQQYNAVAAWLENLPKGNEFARFLIETPLPFKRTPMNIAKTAVDYSPAGLLKTVTKNTHDLKTGKINGNQYIDNISKGITGTGLFALGMLLRSMGILRGKADKDDKKGKYEEALDRQAYSINIGGISISLDWLTPTTIPLFMGVESYENVENKKWFDSETMYYNGISMINLFAELSYLESIGTLFKSFSKEEIKYEEVNGKVTSKEVQRGFSGVFQDLVSNYISQYFPGIIGDFNKIIDPTIRTTYTSPKENENPIESFVKNIVNSSLQKIPGGSFALEPDIDIYGNEKTKKYIGGHRVRDYIFRTFDVLHASNIKASKEDNVSKEIEKVYSYVKNKDVIPKSYVSAASYGFTYNGKRYKPDAQEATKMRKTYGETMYNSLKALFNTKTYKKASEDEKAKMITNVYEYSEDVMKKEYLKKKSVDYKNKTADVIYKKLDEPVYQENAVKYAIEHDVDLTTARKQTKKKK